MLFTNPTSQILKSDTVDDEILLKQRETVAIPKQVIQNDVEEDDVLFLAHFWKLVFKKVA